MNRKLLLMGANNPETLRVIAAMNASGANYEVVGWLDNDESKINTDLFGIKVLGPPNVLLEKKYEECFVFNNVTRNGEVRETVTEQLKRYTDKFASVIHPSVNLINVTVGQGVYIQEGVFVQSHVMLGDHSVLMSASSVGHESHVGNNSIIASGCVVAGLCSIGEGATVWTGAKISPRLIIGNHAVVGINSSVLRDVPDSTTVYGNPARVFFRNNSQKQ